MAKRLPLRLFPTWCFWNMATAALAPAPTSPPDAPSLVRRATCPADMFQCPTSLGAVFSDICCYDGQSCALDNDNNPACCPEGVVCTGAAPTGNPTAESTHEVSYVSNSYFSFPYAATEFDNSAACASAITACSENFNLCTANLGGSNGDQKFGVTIQVPEGGGVTVGGTAPDIGASATSVCSSLSSQACSALKATDCDKFGDDSGAVTLSSTGPGVIVALLAFLLT